MIRAFLFLSLLGLGLAFAGPGAAEPRQPKLIEGKSELFQRILTRPGASLAQGVGAPGEKPLPAFTPLFVYERHPVDGGGETYIEVGTDAKGTVVGFLPESQTVPWRHALVLAFSDRVSRERTLFFRDEASLDAWLDAPDLVDRAAEARTRIDAGTLPGDSPVLTIEPEVHVDFEENFYMLPVLSATQRRLSSGLRARNVEIASVTLAEEPSSQPLKRRINPEDLAGFRAGVMFVIDASSSMGPYIERTQAVMDRVLSRVEAAGLTDKVRFGLVAYRDDPGEVEGIEFLTQTFADPNEIDGARAFAAAVDPLEASRVSTRAFAEDSFAAIDAALRTIDWSEFGARYLVLITDASSRTARPVDLGDGRTIPASTTQYSVDGMAELIRANKAALYALHLMTPAGTSDHERAAQQYRTLSRFEGTRPLYFPVEAGDPERFAAAVESLADAIVEQVQGAYAAVTAASAPAEPPAGEDEALKQTAALIGRAMALRYLGRAEEAEAPTMFRAWASDRDFADPALRSFSVRVLLTKNQLSDLQKTLQLTVDALEAGQIDPDDLFNQLRSAAIAAGRDPEKMGQGEARNMEESGLIGEYLEGLPYQSRLMSLSEDAWIAMGVGDQQAIIDEAYANIRLYQALHDDPDRWIELNEGADPGDHVYPLPLEALP